MKLCYFVISTSTVFPSLENVRNNNFVSEIVHCEMYIKVISTLKGTSILNITHFSPYFSHTEVGSNVYAIHVPVQLINQPLFTTKIEP